MKTNPNDPAFSTRPPTGLEAYLAQYRSIKYEDWTGGLIEKYLKALIQKLNEGKENEVQSEI